LCTAIGMWRVGYSKLHEILRGTQGVSFPLETCCVQCPAQSGAVHLDSLLMACLCRVRLTITLFVVASAPVTWMGLWVALNCLPWCHNDVTVSSVPLASLGRCQRSSLHNVNTQFTEGKMIPMRRREKYEILFSLPPHISHVSIEGCVWDIHWVGENASYKKWVNISSDSGYFCMEPSGCGSKRHETYLKAYRMDCAVLTH